MLLEAAQQLLTTKEASRAHHPEISTGQATAFVTLALARLAAAVTTGPRGRGYPGRQ